ncbi:ribosome biogenesis protein BMS1, partial [Lecanoromycetidae sp. Uapishka_2]
MEDQANRPHRKTKEKKKHTGDRNPKAFGYANPGRLAKAAVRSYDIKEKRLHVPLVDRLPEEAPPIIVAVVGPPGVGKSTLIKSLIKRYTKHSLSVPTGPLTVVTSKRRRLTFIECPADSLASMIDVSKIADIVLLMIDGNFGFEMETMEFLNVLGTSGMPGNVFGILTHLDLFRKPATLKDAKKRLKHRFWSELYQGAKLFYLSGVINGRYPDREVHNLSRFISVMKNPRPLIWRNSHPYCLADRMLDVTAPTRVEENTKCDRTIALYGYLRGTNFPAEGARVHIPGVGDLSVSAIEALPDPCPTPFMDQVVAKASGKSGRRRLGEKQKVLFAPMSDVGGVLMDKDAVYIDVKTSNFDKDVEGDEERGLGEQMVVGLQGERKLLGEMEDGVRLFSGGELLKDRQDPDGEYDAGRKQRRNARIIEREQGDDVSEPDDEGFVSGVDGENEEEDGGSFENGDISTEKLGRVFKQASDSPSDGDIHGGVAFADSDSDIGSVSSVEDQELESGLEDSELGDDEDEEDAALRWKSNLTENARMLHGAQKRYRVSDFARLLYDESLTPAEVIRKWRGEDNAFKVATGDASGEDVEEDENFFRKAKNDEEEDLEDRLIPEYDYNALAQKWNDTGNLENLRQRFASAKLTKERNNDGDESDEEVDEDANDEGDGDFQDLEAESDAAAGDGQVNVENSLEAEREKNARRKEELKLRFEEEDREGFGKQAERAEVGANDEEEFGEDDWYEAQKTQIQKQLTINRAEFESLDPTSRVGVEGYKAGTYARIVLENVPYEFAATFNPRFPVVIGGLAPTEDRFGFVQVRIKRHRWHKKILKTNDPLIFSLGWRRFQTLPVYSISDSRTRNRMLKYTPEHMHCFGTFYGPLIAPNTGFSCVQSFSSKTPGFRIAATGVVLNVDESTEIVKKLKLTGTPYKIFRNTAFIRDMFSTSLEIAKFEGASIRTVSGIRGQIKRALSKPEGHFRATFEDKVLMSDIVFLRAWYPVKPHKFYNPVTNLLEPSTANPASEDSKDDTWQGMRLTGQIRADAQLPTPSQPNSAYKPVERPTRHFNPLRVPRALAAGLPFKSQIAQMAPQKKQTYLQKRAVVLGGEEKRARDLMQKIMTLRNEKVEKRRKKQEERKEPYRRKVKENEEKRAGREKRERDEYWRKEGKKQLISLHTHNHQRVTYLSTLPHQAQFLQLRRLPSFTTAMDRAYAGVVAPLAIVASITFASVVSMIMGSEPINTTTPSSYSLATTTVSAPPEPEIATSKGSLPLNDKNAAPDFLFLVLFLLYITAPYTIPELKKAWIGAQNEFNTIMSWFFGLIFDFPALPTIPFPAPKSKEVVDLRVLDPTITENIWLIERVVALEIAAEEQETVTKAALELADVALEKLRAVNERVAELEAEAEKAEGRHCHDIDELKKNQELGKKMAISKLKEDVTKLMNEREDLAKDLEDAEEELYDCKRDKRDLHDENTTLKAELGTVRADVQGYKMKADSMEDLSKDLMFEKEELSGQYEELKERNAQADRNYDNLQEEYREESAAREALEGEKGALENDNYDLNNRLEELTSEHEGLKRDHEEMKNDHEEFFAEMAENAMGEVDEEEDKRQEKMRKITDDMRDRVTATKKAVQGGDYTQEGLLRLLNGAEEEQGGEEGEKSRKDTPPPPPPAAEES